MRSYAIFRRLGISDQEYIRRIQRESLTLADYTLLIYAKTHKKLSLEDCFSIAKKKRDLIRDKLSDIQVAHGLFNNLLPESKIIHILEFHGFKSLDKLPKRFLRNGYCYITSSKLLNGKLYIFPSRFYDDYKNHGKASHYQKTYEDLNCSGLVRLYYSFEYKNLKQYGKR